MDEVLQFLAENPIFYIATVEDDQPRVRPFGFVTKYNGRLYLCTGSKKPVYKQLQANPKFEICASAPRNWLRLTGKAVFVDDLEVKKQTFREAPGIASIYKDPASPDFAMFYIQDAEANFCVFGQPPHQIKF